LVWLGSFCLLGGFGVPSLSFHLPPEGLAIFFVSFICCIFLFPPPRSVPGTFLVLPEKSWSDRFLSPLLMKPWFHLFPFASFILLFDSPIFRAFFFLLPTTVTFFLSASLLSCCCYLFFPHVFFYVGFYPNSHACVWSSWFSFQASRLGFAGLLARNFEMGVFCPSGLSLQLSLPDLSPMFSSFVTIPLFLAPCI